MILKLEKQLILFADSASDLAGGSARATLDFPHHGIETKPPIMKLTRDRFFRQNFVIRTF